MASENKVFGQNCNIYTHLYFAFLFTGQNRVFHENELVNFILFEEIEIRFEKGDPQKNAKQR